MNFPLTSWNDPSERNKRLKPKKPMARSIRKPAGPFTVEDASQSQIHEEIARQAAKGMVVLACGPDTLDLIISGLEHFAPDSPEFTKGQEMAASLKQLRKGAFGE